jgi:hypothetical protein
MLSRYGGITVFFVLLAASFATYFYAIADIPYRDHLLYMQERTFMDSDWDWFWHSLSWMRTRILWGEDSYLFRPLHMAVLALKDIMFRNNLFMQGAINIFLMAVAGFSLYLFANRLIGRLSAVAIAVLFIAQHAGLEMVTWGHINPYVIALSFLGFGLTAILKTDAQNQTNLIWAGVFLFLGTLVHEIITVALALTAMAFAYVMLRSGMRAEAGGVPLRRYLVRAMAVPLVVSLGLNLIDYFINGAPQHFDTLVGDPSKLHSAFLTVSGAPLVAFLSPFMVDFILGVSGIRRWDFSGFMPLVIGAGAVMGVALIYGIFLCIRSFRKGKGSPLTLATLMAMFTFCAFIIGVGYGRVYLRDVIYLYYATYYFSITGYIFCLLSAIGLHHMYNLKRFERIKTRLRAAVFVVILALIAVNVTKTIKTLKPEWPERYETALIHIETGRTLSEHEDVFCLAGLSPKAVQAAKGLQSVLLRKHFCRTGDTRRRVYLVAGANGSLWLADMQKQPVENARGAQKVEMEPRYWNSEILKGSYPHKDLGDEMPFFVSLKDYDRPDLSLTLRHGLNAAVILGYQNSENFVAFKIVGPIVSVRTMKDGQLSSLMHRNALPSVEPEYRLELRHAGPYIYFFVNDNLITFMPSVFEQPGRLGMAFQKSRINETSFGDFVAAPSKELSPPAFKPMVRIPD